MNDDKTPTLLDRLRHPRWRWLRIPVGFGLVAGGVFGFLPVIGFWMLPLGLSVLALDFPAAERANRRITLLGRRFVLWARRRRGARPDGQ